MISLLESGASHLKLRNQARFSHASWPKYDCNLSYILNYYFIFYFYYGSCYDYSQFLYSV